MDTHKWFTAIKSKDSYDEIVLSLLKSYAEIRYVVINNSGSVNHSSDDAIDTLSELVSIMGRGLESLKNYPNDGEMLYMLLRYTYFTGSKVTVEEIMAKLQEQGFKWTVRTYYKYRSKALDVYGMLIERELRDKILN